MTAPPNSESEDSAAPHAPPRLAESVPSADPWERVKDHKVLQWGLAYLGAALALAHGADLLGHTFRWPETFNRLLLGVLIIGFPVALALAWYHGHRSLKTVGTGEATIISILLLIGAGLLMLFVRPPAEETASTSPVTTTVAPDTAARHPLSAPDGGASIAVLPFVNMSSDREQDYFSDGLSEELLNELTHVPNLRVIGRTSVFAFKGKNEDLRAVGETLGVDHILEGSVRKVGDNLRITAQLINPADGSHLWSGTYDRKLGDVFEIQEEIARTVASALQLPIVASNLGEGGTHNFQAYDAFLRAMTSTSELESISHFERAVELDPQFTQAWLGLAAEYDSALLFSPERTAEWQRKGRAAGDRVLALAPQSAEAKVLQATREIEVGNLLQADNLYQAARDQNLNIAIGGQSQLMLALGRPRDALAGFRLLRQTDPVAQGPRIMLQISYEQLEDYKQAAVEFQSALAVLPDDPVIKSTALLRAMGQRDEAGIHAAVALTKPLPLAIGQAPSDPDQANFAMAALLDNPPAALSQLHRWSTDSGLSRQPSVQFSEAYWAAYFGDPSLSLQLLRRMPRDNHSTRSALMLSLWRPVEKNVRRLPAFKDFAAELGLVKYWRTGGNWGEFCHALGDKDFECN